MSPTSLIFFPCLPMFLLSPTSSSSTSSSRYPFYPIAACVPVAPLLSLSFPCSSTVASPFFYALLLALSCPCPVPGATCCLLPCTNKPVTPCSCHGACIVPLVLAFLPRSCYSCRILLVFFFLCSVPPCPTLYLLSAF